MLPEPKVLVIIPAYNEESNLLDVVSSVVDAGFDYVVVNDGSSDETLEVCKKHDFNVLDLCHNLGIGGSVQTGHQYAYRLGYDIDIQFDGDGQHDAQFLKDLVSSIMDGADMCIGSRYLDTNDGFQSTVMRRFGKSIISFLIRATTGAEITDPTSGFRACGPRVLRFFAQSYPVDYPEPESIVAVLKSGYIVEERSVRMHERVGGQSSIGLLDSIYYMIKVSLAVLTASFTYSGQKGRK